jgi:hypothetical protein
LGRAFLYRQQDVMDSIQRLRAQAQALGNLQTTPQENVITDNGSIEILPANPEVIYVPVYQPQMVYYQRPYGSPLSPSESGWQWAHGSITTLIGTITMSSSGAPITRALLIGGHAVPVNVHTRRRLGRQFGNRIIIPARLPEIPPRMD